MAVSRILVTVVFLYLVTYVVCKIVLPHNLRYLENMLNADVVAKAAKIRQHMEANPNAQDSEKGWPALLAKYQEQDKNKVKKGQSFGFYNRRYPA